MREADRRTRGAASLIESLTTAACSAAVLDASRTASATECIACSPELSAVFSILAVAADVFMFMFDPGRFFLTSTISGPRNQLVDAMHDTGVTPDFKLRLQATSLRGTQGSLKMRGRISVEAFVRVDFDLKSRRPGFARFGASNRRKAIAPSNHVAQDIDDQPDDRHAVEK